MIKKYLPILIILVLLSLTSFYIKDYVGIRIIKFILMLVIPYMIYKPAVFAKSGDKKILFVIGTAIGVSAIIVTGYLVLKQYIDVEPIVSYFKDEMNLTKKGIILAGLYTIFANSLIEEFFFRGVAYLHLKKFGFRYAGAISAILFALYHVSIMDGWFSLPITILLVTGLFIGGMIFNKFCDYTGSLYGSWIVHIFADISVVSIGFLLLGII